MTESGAWLTWLVMAWALLTCVVGMGAVLMRWRLRAPRSSAAVATRRCLLVRPCAGDEQGLESNLDSILRAHFSFEVEVCFALGQDADPAYETAHRVCQRLKDAGIPATVGVFPPQGPNRKVSQLSGAMEGAEGFDVFLNVDSNVDLAGVDLDCLVGALDGDVGAGWATHSEASMARDWGNWASEAVLGGSLHAFGLLCALDPAGLVGKLFAVRTDVLAKIGGLSVLSDYLGEDMELSRRVRQAGYRVLPIPLGARSTAGPMGWSQAMQRFSRWITVIRAQRPGLLVTYPLLFFPTLPLLCFSAWVGAGSPTMGAISAIVALVGRGIIGVAARHWSGRPLGLRGVVADMVLADTLLMAAFSRAVFRRQFQWRGVPLRIDRHGKLEAG